MAKRNFKNHGVKILSLNKMAEVQHFFPKK